MFKLPPNWRIAPPKLPEQSVKLVFVIVIVPVVLNAPEASTYSRISRDGITPPFSPQNRTCPFQDIRLKHIFYLEIDNKLNLIY